MGCNTSSTNKISDVGVASTNNKTTLPPIIETKEEEKNDIEEEAVVDNNQIQEKEEQEAVAQLKVPTPKQSRGPTPVSIASDTDYTSNRLLLLGSAESGKTTLLEQVRVLYKQHFTDSEIYHRRSFIYHNIFKSIKCLVKAMKDGRLEYEDPINRGRAQLIEMDTDGHYGLFTKGMVENIKHIWNDAAVQRLYERRSTFNLNDSTAYFLGKIDKINTIDYMPSGNDLIMSYVPTIGVQNVVFSARNQTFQLFDIGGHQIDRRKWATQYDGIDAIFFCLAISEYDQVMNEDMTTNRFDDALRLLQQINQEPKFENTPIYLFLNEVDVFCEKLQVIPLQKYIEGFQGGDSDDALDFMESLAVASLSGRDKSLYRVYRCIAIDTQMMSEILSVVFKDIMKRKKKKN